MLERTGLAPCLVLRGSQDEWLRTTARESRSEEVCGLLVGSRADDGWTVTRMVACRNTLPPERRARHFAIDPLRVIDEERATRSTDEDVIGFYHSHPVGEAIPSHVDREYMTLWPDAVWIIVAVEPRGAGIRAWVSEGGDSDAPQEVQVVRSPSDG